MTGIKAMMTLSTLSLILAAPSLAQAPARQQATVQVPVPMRGQGEPLGNYETGIVIDRYIGDPNIAPAKITHGTMYVQRIFGPGDFFTGSAGNVLAPGRETDLATLRPRDQTTMFKTPKQLLFYVESGEGRLDDGNQFWDLSNGIAVMVPANMAHRLTNTGNEPLKMILYSLDPPSGAAPLSAIMVRDSHRLAMVGRNLHWNNNFKMLFGSEAGVEPVMLVSFGPMTGAGPSASALQRDARGGGAQWIRVSGGSGSDMAMQLGSEVRHWPTNTGFVAPADGQTVHGLYNVGEAVEDALVIMGGGPPATSAPLPGMVDDPQVAQSYRDAVVPGRPLPAGR
jgi:mannose-6-phosphate isomerase-like protein (cupin superfamily)